MLWGILTAVAFLLSAAKYLTRRFGSARLDRAALQVHRFSALALLVLAVVHTCSVWGLRGQHPAAMTVLGIAMLAGIFVLLWSHIRSRAWGRKWLAVHRWATLEVLLCLLAHIAVGVWG